MTDAPTLVRPVVPPGADDNWRNTELLNAELPDTRFVDGAGAVDPAYLRWLYDENPHGTAYQEGVDEDGLRMAHYALIPQVYRNADGVAPFIFSLNAVSRTGAQRKGYFGMLQLRVWSRARDEGVVAGIGVTNARSHRGVQVMGWRFAGPMPVEILTPAPVRTRGWHSTPVTPELLASPTFDELAAGLDDHPATNWTNTWSPDYLRWRLGAPRGATWTLHASDDLLVVSTLSHVKGLPVAVIVKFLLRNGSGADAALSGQAAVTEVCRFHRTPGAVYAGFNRFVKVRGIPLPDRAKPAPLNLEVCSLTDQVRQRDFELDTYEFLDMDAY